MPLSNYLKIKVGDNEIIISDPKELPVSIDYLLEDSEEFQNKKSSEAQSIEIPANINNDLASNTFTNPDIEDLTLGQVFKSARACVIECNSYELLVGKAFLQSAKHTNRPKSYTYNFLGNNADWIVDLTDKTIYDFISFLSIEFTKSNIENSWDFDGTNESLPYVFAPVRYRFPFNDYYSDAQGILQPDDENVDPTYLRPSLSKYWILFWAFKSLGYRISSDFLDSEYFRRQVMPWTFGNFLDSGGTKLEIHKFLAKSTGDQYFDSERGKAVDRYVDLDVSNDSTLGAFDNNNDYTYVAPEMKWTYNAPDFGSLDATFSMTVYFVAALSGSNSNLTVRVDWFVNSVLKQQDIIVQGDGGIIGTDRPSGQTDVFFRTQDYGTPLSLGDVVSAQVHIHLYRDKNAVNDVAHVLLNVLSFQLDYFRIPLGGNIAFTNLTALQQYKILDYIAGIIDEFDLSIDTDPINKIVYIEPTHEYSLNNNLATKSGGFFKNDFIDWNGKEDLSKEWNMENYSDQEREFIFQYKNDTNDGILKTIQDRNTNILAQAKYVFPTRFQIGQKTRENRFFGPTMHYDVVQWQSLGTGDNTNIAPQMVVIVPENVSNTSQSESDNTFTPKSCYYKGNLTGSGAWRFDGDVLQTYPFMFAVNYQSGGENDPILSYGDQLIGSTIAKGLLKRFFWQRLAISRNGQRYSTWFRLFNSDVCQKIHREFISYKGQRWELIQIKGYKPLANESASCLMYKWSPITEEDYNNTFPSAASVNTGVISGELDIKYAALKCLTSDIPT